MAIGCRQNQDSLTPSISPYNSVKARLRNAEIAKHILLNNIPIEVLVEIFLSLYDKVYDNREVHPPHAGTLPRISLHRDTFLDPMALAQVCGQWRIVAFYTPLLWSSIDIQVCYDKRQLAPLLGHCLSLSGNSPLDVRFVECIATDPEVSRQNPRTAEIMSLSVTQAYRWKTNDFTFLLQIPAIISGLSPGSSPLLETASIISRDADTDMASLEKVRRTVHSSPSLRNGRWVMEYLERNLDEIPWGQLTTIEVTASLESLLRILPLCQNLVELRYTDNFALRLQSSNECQSKGIIMLPSVQSLTLRINQPTNTVLDHLTLPALLSFDVHVCKGDTERVHASALKDLLTRSGCHLQAFTYDSPAAEAEEVVTEILSFPELSSLVALDIRHRTTDKLMHLLKRSSPERSILPRLETLVLGHCSTREGALSAMALSRQSILEDIATLSVLEVGRWDHHPLDLECFQILLDEGMDVRV
ncbi:hypothetical protein C0993_001320 [Termitomyces sp. T159_Od127]|nr:hypothetical protein C0993_001320 [Termitomyces sp. T159_Od127]